MQKKNSMPFSKRVVFVNTLLAVIPVFLLLLFITLSSLYRQVMITRRNSSDTISTTVGQINDKLRSFNLIQTMINSNDTLKMFFILPESYNEDDVINTLKTQTSILENVSTITPYIYSIRLFPTNPIIPERWPMILHESRITDSDKNYWSFNYKADFMGNLNYMKMESVCTTREITKNHRLIGYLQIAVRMEDFFPSVYYNSNPDSFDYAIRTVSLDSNNAEVNSLDLYIEDICINPNNENQEHDNRRLLTSQEKKDILKILRKTNLPTGTASLGKWYKTVSWRYIPDMNIYYIHIDTGRQLFAEFIHDLLLILLTLVVLIVLLSISIKYITNKLLAGVYSVMDGMKQVKAGDYNVQIPITGINELSETQETFNSMTRKLQEQIEQIKTEQSLIADTEMKAMQNQINAHFLYNVLETIRMQAVLADQDEIEESLQVLGKMMRYCLRWRIHRVPLSQEIDYIRSYIYILNIRNDYTISLQVEIPEDLMDVEIPKMTLQPLVENAFVHAIEETEADATLKVYAQLAEDKSRVYLSVQDFGKGMNQDELNKIQSYLDNDSYERDSKGSIGLKNIQQRLTVFYGQDYRIKIQSQISNGTTITVPVPNVRSEQ